MESEILQCLAASLNTDPNARMSAELKLNELFAKPETCLALSSITNAQDIDVSLRQMTVIVLHKYVKERWSPVFPSFKGNPPSVEIKSLVRDAVFKALSDPNRKIRSSSAHTLSLIANADWPDEYPNLLASLIGLLSSSSLDSVHGSMQVFNEFIKTDLTEDQILPVLRELLPVLLNILGSTQHTPLTRAKAVSVFRQCITTLYMVKEQHPQAVKEATSSILPVWIDAFKLLLRASPENDVQNVTSWDALAIRIEVFRALDTVHLGFAKSLAPHYDELLDIALAHLRTLLPTFSRHYLSKSSIPPPSASEEEPIELSMLGCPIIDFIAVITRNSKAKSWLQSSNVESLIIALCGWMQMTEDDEENWGNDANAFVAHEDDETQSYSLRVAGLDLLANLLEREPGVTVHALSQAVNRLVSESQQARKTGNTEWWRPLEAALVALGSVSDGVTDFCEDEEEAGRPKPINIEVLLTDVIPQLLSLSDCPFLQGRSFVFASQYSKLLPSQLADQYMSAAITVMENENAGIPIKVSAVKAIQNFASGMDESILLPVAFQIAKDLGPFLLVTNEDTLSLVLETLSSVVNVGKGAWISPELAEQLSTAMLRVWVHNNKDPILISILTDIFTSIASSSKPDVYQSVVKTSLPNLCNAITTAKSDECWVTSSAIELVTSLVEGAPEGGLGEGFFATLAPCLFECLRTAEDRDVLQNGVLCLTWIVRKDVKQILEWRDSSGQSGADRVLAVIAKLLENEDESGGLVIGDLIIHLLRRATSSIVPVLPELLQAMVRRMQTAKTATFVQSLVIPFAFLVQSERDTVLSLLEGIDVNGRSGLDILIQTWCENAEVFQGFWPSRVSTLGLCQLFASERPSLQNLTVKGDIIVTPETRDVIVTRSRAKKTPHEFTKISFPVKALKLIVNDLRSDGESATMGTISAQAGVTGSDDGVREDDWEDEDSVNPLNKDEIAFLSDMLGPRAGAFDEDNIPDDMDDEDLKNDPISQMDMTAHLISFVKECASRNANGFADIVGQMNAEEMLVVQRVVNESRG
ncbi:ARM repeat-containing protein [Fomitiporia mediterranea MF3/22]|uniref:ARM repeat-containing protein n=1 Tax=Fomitiporia mediterranea (strain MF3/22) TaxID=694068 RepID=UPI00044073E6|nr:ARM repeat-containing protein [Fomitiporia mediterranea MF3/22]EJD03488.1 ARM repeat-containing protein [Fomitiporia mediterranea MF3/22]